MILQIKHTLNGTLLGFCFNLQSRLIRCRLAEGEKLLGRIGAASLVLGHYGIAKGDHEKPDVDGRCDRW